MSSKKRKSAKKKQSKKSKAKKSKATKRMSRLECSVAAINQIKTKLGYKDGIQKADNIYAGQPNGGKSNLKEAKYAFDKAAKVMILLHLIRVEKGTIIRLKA